MSNKKIVFGVDPGFDRCGFGVIAEVGGNFSHVAHGVITPPKGELVQRLLWVHQELGKLLKQYKPTLVGLEHIYFTKNAKTAINVGQARGVILLTLAQYGQSVKEFTPLQIKQAVTGFGQAPKEQVQKMVQLILRLPSLPTPDDAADGLAIALCAAQHSGPLWNKK